MLKTETITKAFKTGIITKVPKTGIITKMNVTTDTNTMKSLTIEMIEHSLKVQTTITKQQCIHQNTYHTTQNSTTINTTTTRANSLTQRSMRTMEGQIRTLNAGQNELRKEIQ